MESDCLQVGSEVSVLLQSVPLPVAFHQSHSSVLPAWTWRQLNSLSSDKTPVLLRNIISQTQWVMTVWGKFKRWEYQTPWPASWEICMQVKKQHLEPDIEQWTGSKLGKEYVRAIYCHLTYLTYMPSTLCEMLGWMKHKLKSRLLGEISITSVRQNIPPLWQKAKN